MFVKSIYLFYLLPLLLLKGLGAELSQTFSPLSFLQICFLLTWTELLYTFLVLSMYLWSIPTVCMKKEGFISKISSTVSIYPSTCQVTSLSQVCKEKNWKFYAIFQTQILLFNIFETYNIFTFLLKWISREQRVFLRQPPKDVLCNEFLDGFDTTSIGNIPAS